MNESTFVYVIYMATTPEKLWEALNQGELTCRYWFGRRIESDWKEGLPVTFRDEAERVTDKGHVCISEPCHRLSYTFVWLENDAENKRSTRVNFELTPMASTVKLTLRHEDLMPNDYGDEREGFRGINNGWPAILSNLKSLLETGRTLPALTIA